MEGMGNNINSFESENKEQKLCLAVDKKIKELCKIVRPFEVIYNIPELEQSFTEKIISYGKVKIGRTYYSEVQNKDDFETIGDMLEASRLWVDISDKETLFSELLISKLLGPVLNISPVDKYQGKYLSRVMRLSDNSYFYLPSYSVIEKYVLKTVVLDNDHITKLITGNEWNFRDGFFYDFGMVHDLLTKKKDLEPMSESMLNGIEVNSAQEINSTFTTFGLGQKWDSSLYSRLGSEIKNGKVWEYFPSKRNQPVVWFIEKLEAIKSYLETIDIENVDSIYMLHKDILPVNIMTPEEVIQFLKSNCDKMISVAYEYMILR